MDALTASPRAARMARLHGSLFLIIGLWPLIHLRSFAWATGPKPEGWLVKKVGALGSVIGLVLLIAGRHRRVIPEARLLAQGGAAAFSSLDIFYVARRRISPVFLGHAALQATMLAGWGVAARRERSGQAEHGTPRR